MPSPAFRLLIIEDSDNDYEDIVDALQYCLKSAEISRISTEREFHLRQEEISALQPHLIILDVILSWRLPDPTMEREPLPGKSYRAGVRIWNLLQQNSRMKDTPTIVCTYLDVQTFTEALAEHPANLHVAPRKDAGEIATLAMEVLLNSPRVLSEGGIACRNVVPTPKKLFVSYAREDRQSLYNIRSVMMPMVRSNRIEFWDDTQVADGQPWRSQIMERMNSADGALFLASSESLASEFIYEVEIPHFVKRYKQERLPLFWVALRPALFANTELGQFQCLNDPEHPLEHLSSRQKELALVGIAQKLVLGLGIIDPATGA